MVNIKNLGKGLFILGSNISLRRVSFVAIIKGEVNVEYEKRKRFKI